jgi:hypothetical protein
MTLKPFSLRPNKDFTWWPSRMLMPGTDYNLSFI